METQEHAVLFAASLNLTSWLLSSLWRMFVKSFYHCQLCCKVKYLTWLKPLLKPKSSSINSEPKELKLQHRINFFDKASDLAAKVDEIPTILKVAARQQPRAHVPAATPKEYWKRALYIPFLDHIIQEVLDHLAGNEERFQAEHLIPSKLEGFTNGTTQQI